jgi:hypothetical protein
MIHSHLRSLKLPHSPCERASFERDEIEQTACPFDNNYTPPMPRTGPTSHLASVPEDGGVTGPCSRHLGVSAVLRRRSRDPFDHVQG